MLLEFQSDTETKIRLVTMHNDIKKFNAKQKEHIKFTIHEYCKYKSNQNNIYNFLSQVGPRYKGKKLFIRICLIILTYLFYLRATMQL